MNKFSESELQKCFTDVILKKDYNKELFSLIAPKYNIATKILSLGNDQSWKRKLIKELPEIKNPVCLDLACGTGDVTFKLAEKYITGKIYGLDITPDMIHKARYLNTFKNIEFVCQDICKINFEDNSFDIITGSYALRNAPDLNKALKEINRILKTGGTFAVLDFSKFDNNIAQKIEYFILRSWGNFCGLLLHGNHTIYGYIAESLKHYPAHSEFESLIKNFNFEIVKQKKLFLGIIQINILTKK